MEHVSRYHSRDREATDTHLASTRPHLPLRPAPRTPQTVFLPSQPVRTYGSDGSYVCRVETSSSASFTDSATSLSALQDARTRSSQDLEAQDMQSGRLEYSRIQARDAQKLPAGAFNNPFRSPVPVSIADITTVTYDSEPPERRKYEGKALRLLIYLSGLCGLLSFVLLFYTLLSLIITILIQPLRFCSSRPSFRQQLVDFLAPLLNLQLRCIYTTPLPNNYSASMLLLVHILSPFVSVGVAIAAWTSAVFWFYTAILGDPDGKDKHNDGKDTVLGVRMWWEKWLLRAAR